MFPVDRSVCLGLSLVFGVVGLGSRVLGLGLGLSGTGFAVSGLQTKQFCQPGKASLVRCAEPSTLPERTGRSTDKAWLHACSPTWGLQKIVAPNQTYGP